MPAPTDAQLSADLVRVGICAFLDIQGSPLRHALAPLSIVTPASTVLEVADPDFDNRTFTTLDPRMVSISPVRHAEGGTDSVQFTLSGALEFDSAVMTDLSDPAKFRGRVAKLWLVRFGEDWAVTHARPFYVGYMATPHFSVGAERQTITVTAENYLALVGSGAPARSLLSQKDYDSGDESAAATLGTAAAGNALGPGFTSVGGGALIDFALLSSVSLR